MKRIEFIAPVEAMRGNLSGSQKLVYAQNDNPAWDAPEGKSFARNYKPRFIGAKRAATGATIFATKVRSAINNSTKVKVAQAVLGSMPMLQEGVESNLSINSNLYACYNASKQKAQGYSLRKYFIEKIQSQLSRGAATITIMERSSGRTYTCAFANPYIKPGTSSAETIGFDSAILDKFFDQLSNGFRFTIEGAGQGIAFGGWDWLNVASSNEQAYPQYNVLGLSEGADHSGFVPIMLGDKYVCVKDGDEVYGAVNSRVINNTLGDGTPTYDFILEDAYHAPKD